MNFQTLLPHVPAFLMVLFRITGVFVLAPVLGSPTIPMRVKVFLAVTLTLCVYPMVLTSPASAPGLAHIAAGGLSLWTLGPLIGAELLIGYAVGYLASLPLAGVQSGGHLIDQQMGLGIAGLYNPELDEQGGVTSEIMFIGAMAVFVLLGGHRAMLSVLVGSFDRIPPGGMLDADALAGLTHLAVGLLTVMFELALRVSAPLLCLIFIERMAMGFIARTVPQMNILSVGFAVNILTGLAVTAAAAGLALTAFGSAWLETLRRMSEFFTP